MLPDDFDTIAKVVKDITVLGAFACVDTVSRWQEATYNTFDMTTYIELLGIVNTYTLYSQAETSNPFDNHGLTISKTMPHQVLKFGHSPDETSL